MQRCTVAEELLYISNDYLPIKIYGTVIAPAITSDVVGILNVIVPGAEKLISRNLNVLRPLV